MKLLAIESSCDETAAAVVEDGRRVLSSLVSSQIEQHKKFGGVVPEIASRLHCETISALTRQTLERAGMGPGDLDAVAVTYAPGLIGALLVGVNFAKGLALSAGLPLVPVHHIRGHIAANYLAFPQLEPPFLALVVSGGHSNLVQVAGYTDFRVLASTCDDAAGEAYDKAARVLGFDYPGGVHIDRAARRGDPDKYPLPRPKVAGSDLDFSFSGLKTAVINTAHRAAQRGEALDRDSLAASFQKTVVEILTGHLYLAAERTKMKKIVLAGGVAANSGLRESLEAGCRERGLTLYLPPVSLCGDNAAMIGAQGYYEWLAGTRAGLELNAYPSREIGKGYPD